MISIGLGIILEFGSSIFGKSGSNLYLCDIYNRAKIEPNFSRITENFTPTHILELGSGQGPQGPCVCPWIEGKNSFNMKTAKLSMLFGLTADVDNNILME